MPTVDSYRAQTKDESYHPDDSVRDTIQNSDDDIAGERKLIIFESQQLTVFQRCHSCGIEVELKTSTVSTMLVVDGTCPDGYVQHWQSQPTVNCTPAGNLLLAAAILLCGLTFTNITNLAGVLNLAMFCEKQYNDFQKK